MSRHLVLTLAFAVVLGLATKGVFARGGGHGGGRGGGHHGGGHHGGAQHHAGHHDAHHGNHHVNHHHHAHYAHHDRPFTHGWYGHHHGAWGGWGWGNAWAPAAFGTAAAWLGLSAADSVIGGYQPVETVTTADTSDKGDQSDEGDQDAPANNETEQDADQPAADEAQPQQFAPSTQAAELIKSGVTDPPKDAKLLPLGVYSLAPKGQHEASAMLQLSVSKDGVLRGSYYDLLSNQAHPVQGAVDKKTQRVAWTVGSNGKVLFETSLANLTQETGPLSVHYENGQSRQWTVARYEGAADEAADTVETPAEPKSN